MDTQMEIKTSVPHISQSSSLAQQARMEMEKNGYVTVTCPKCHTKPVVSTTPGGERSTVRCKCGYVSDMEIYF